MGRLVRVMDTNYNESTASVYLPALTASARTRFPFLAVEYRPAGDLAWTPARTVRSTLTRVELQRFLTPGTHEVRVRAVDASGAPLSEYTPTMRFFTVGRGKGLDFLFL